MSDHGEHGEEEARPRRSFTPEFKAEVVELCQRGERSAVDFDLTEAAAREWVKQAERDAAGGKNRDRHPNCILAAYMAART